MIFAASCMLKASPGPIPGAPLKSPMVSLTIPVLRFRTRTGSEVNAVQEVIGLHAQLNFDALGNWDVLEYGEIDGPVPRTMESIASEDRCAGADGRKGGRIPPLFSAGGDRKSVV